MFELEKTFRSSSIFSVSMFRWITTNLTCFGSCVYCRGFFSALFRKLRGQKNSTLVVKNSMHRRQVNFSVSKLNYLEAKYFFPKKFYHLGNHKQILVNFHPLFRYLGKKWHFGYQKLYIYGEKTWSKTNIVTFVIKKTVPRKKTQVNL